MTEYRAHKWYGRAVWRGTNGVRALKLRRTPLCEVLGCDRPATTVDHRKAFMLGKDDAERWFSRFSAVRTARTCVPVVRRITMRRYSPSSQAAKSSIR